MEEKNIQGPKNTVRAVERSLDILSCFINNRELTLTEISNKVKLNKSTVFRIIGTLEKKGFLSKNEDNEKYRLGFKLWELSTNIMGMDDPSIVLLPEMKRLRDKLEETISLYVRDGIERIRIQSVESNQAIRRVAPIGARLPLAVGASSKVLLAFENKTTREAILAQLIQDGQLKKEKFYKRMLDVQAKGYATSFEEREAGAVALSFPIFNRSGNLIAALSVSGPVNRLTEDKIKAFIPIVQESAIRMGNRLK